MEELKAVGHEDNVLVVANSNGERFRLPITVALESQIQRAKAADTNHVRVSPKEIQDLVRSGHSVIEITQLTGAALERVELFAQTVLAEREFVTEQALATRITESKENSGFALSEPITFGDFIVERLQKNKCSQPEWTSFKNANEWIVSLQFHDQSGTECTAQWIFTPSSHHLKPLTETATKLMSEDSSSKNVLWRLHAVDDTATENRFDSGAFENSDTSDRNTFIQQKVISESHELTLNVHAETDSYSNLEHRSTIASAADTTELLAALRRGSNNSSGSNLRPLNESVSKMVTTERIEIIDSEINKTGLSNVTQLEIGNPIEKHPPRPAKEQKPPDETSSAGRSSTGNLGLRRGRAQMPSWDDILFGGHNNDEPA